MIVHKRTSMRRSLSRPEHPEVCKVVSHGETAPSKFVRRQPRAVGFRGPVNHAQHGASFAIIHVAR